MKFTHDVIVIGGGAAGLTAAGGAALFGRKAVLIEKHKMGGECLNNGCVPSKALITAAKRAQKAREGTRHGVTLAEPEVEWSGVHKHVHDTIAAIAPHDSKEEFEGRGVDVRLGLAHITGKHSVTVTNDEGTKELTAPRIVVATGSRPFVPPIEGLDNVPYLTNENLFDLDAQPGHLVIVGGGVIGMEMAQSFRRLGSEVTVINPGPLMGRDDQDSVAVVAQVMRDEGVKFAEGHVKKVEGGEGAVTAHIDSGEVITGTHLLIAVGRTPNISGFGLEELGVETGRGGIVVDARRRTSIKSIYAIGDCRDGPRLTHVSGYEGGNVALEIALGIPTKVDWKALPWCTYTEPEVAQVGMTEVEAREEHGDAINVVKEGFDHNERAIAEDSTKGHIKVVFKGKKVLGVSIVGKGAGELLLPWTQTISGKASSFGMGSAIVSYPTRSEINKAAAFIAWEPTVFGSLPKKWASFVGGVRKKFA